MVPYVTSQQQVLVTDTDAMTTEVVAYVMGDVAARRVVQLLNLYGLEDSPVPDSCEGLES
jgi:hypothetical protein